MHNLQQTFTDISLGIAVNIATKQLEKIQDYIAFYNCSRKVVNEINDAFSDASKSWIKMNGKLRSKIQIQSWLHENYICVNASKDLKSENHDLNEFLELFDFALSKKQIAFNFLTAKKNEANFVRILQEFDSILSQSDEIKAIVSDNYVLSEEINLNVKKILVHISNNTSSRNNLITKDKVDALGFPERFIPSIKKEENFIPRKVKSSVNRNGIEFIFQEEEFKETSFIEYLNSDEHGILILEGEPGIGKSVELRMLAKTLWEDSTNDSIPFYRNLRNFTSQDKIESFLQIDFTEQFLNVIFVLDGIDEIKQTDDFLSKFNNYYVNRINKTSRFVLSCRSNILKKISREIQESETFRLKELNENESLLLFDRLVGTKLNSTQECEFKKSIVIGDPFRIKLMASLFNQEGEIVNDEFKLWDHFISSSLKMDEIKFAKKEVFAPQILDDSKKCATIHELMNEFVMCSETLYKILEKDRIRFDHFTSSSLIDIEFEHDTYHFNHRKIQECLTALFLAELTYVEIMAMCKVKGTESIKPQLENTILLLTSTYHGDSKINELLDWLKKNSPELLFKADLNLLTIDQRTAIFKDYFTTQCIKKTLWIDTNSDVTVSDLVRFADSKESFDFLISIVRNTELNHRARISAINLLQEFNLINENVLINTINDILNGDDNLSYKSSMIRLINKLPMRIRLVTFTNIINLYPDESNKEWNRSLLAILSEFDNIDKFFDYLKREFYWAHFKTRLEYDEVHRGNSWIIMDLVLRLNDESNFLELATYYFDDYNVRDKEPYREALLSKCMTFENEMPGFIVKLLERIIDNDKKRSYDNNEILISLIKLSGTELDAFRILNNIEGKNIKINDSLILARTATKGTIDYLLSFDTLENTSIPQLQSFRNLIAIYGDRELAIYLENRLEDQGIKLGDKLRTNDQLIENQLQLQNEIQENFNLFFNLTQLIPKVEKTISQNNNHMVNMQIVRRLERTYNEINDNWIKGRNVEFDLLFAGIRLYNEQSVSSFMQKLQESEKIRIVALKSILDFNKSAQCKFEISKYQNELIKQWLRSESAKFDFENLVTSEEIGTFTIKRTSDYRFLQTLYYYFEIEEYTKCFDDEFLINSISYYRMEESEPFSHHFDNLVEQIQDKSKLKEAVIKKIKERIFTFPMDRLIVFALNHDFDEAYSDIQEYLEISNVTPGGKLFQLFEQKEPNKHLELLEKIAFDLSTYRGWCAMTELSNHEEKRNDCLFHCKKYLNSGISEYKSNALAILFKLNDPIALTYFMEGIGLNPLYNVANKYRNNYAIYLELLLEKFDKLFVRIYETKNTIDKFDRDWEFTENHTFFSQVLLNVLKKESDRAKAFEQIKKKLIEVQNDTRDDRIIFFANSIIGNLTNNYISLMSQPISFDEALELTTQIIKN